jgi:ADP-heptose:LPS heptosyltransferase
MTEKLIIRHRYALGDTVLLSGLVRDLHAAYPGRFQIKVDTHFTNVWWNNPHLSAFDTDARTRVVEVQWGDAIRDHSIAKLKGKEDHRRHILAWYHHDFEKKTGIHVPVTVPHADLHLSAEEDGRRVSGRYWVVLSGGKLDMTVKHWHVHRMQQVVDTLLSHGIRCVQVGAAHSSHAMHVPVFHCHVKLAARQDNPVPPGDPATVLFCG